MLLKDPFYYCKKHRLNFHYCHGFQVRIIFDWLQSYLKKQEIRLENFQKSLTFIILNTILVSGLLVMLGLLNLLSCCSWTWRSQFTLMRWSTTRSSFSHCLLLGLFLLGHVWNLMWATIEWLMHSGHSCTHSVILWMMSWSRLLLTLCAISSTWPNMTTASWTIHYLDWTIPKGRKYRLWIDICLSLSFLHLPRLWSSVRHIG